MSTLTVDRLEPDESGRRKEQPGGPAHYVCAALDSLGRSYRLITGAVASVDVVYVMGEEHYIIHPIPYIQMPERFTTPAVILSPIMREIDPSAVPPADGLLAIDLQGFVRTPLQRSDVLSHTDLAQLLSHTDIVKGAERELLQLDTESRQLLGDRILVQTMGARGAMIQVHGRRYYVPVSPINAAHTIGAGDNFLGAFVVGMLDTGDPLRSGEYAARFTEQVLRKRDAKAQ